MKVSRNSEQEFTNFKQSVRDEIDAPLLEELFPKGEILRQVRWESHNGRTRLPAHRIRHIPNRD